MLRSCNDFPGWSYPWQEVTDGWMEERFVDERSCARDAQVRRTCCSLVGSRQTGATREWKVRPGSCESHAIPWWDYRTGVTCLFTPSGLVTQWFFILALAYIRYFSMTANYSSVHPCNQMVDYNLHFHMTTSKFCVWCDSQELQSK